jgi:hypothetical protein
MSYNISIVSGAVSVASGQLNVLSGQMQLVSGTVTISGNAVRISGESCVVTSGQVQVMSGTITISGNTVLAQTPTQVLTSFTLQVHGLSGGVSLSGGIACKSVTVRNIGVSGTVMYVGGSGVKAPWVASGQAAYPFISGMGLWMRDGDGITLNITDFAGVRIVSHTSGQYCSYIGVV